MRKRILSVLMALCMVLSLAPTMAWASAPTVKVGNTDVSNGGFWLCSNNVLTQEGADTDNYNVKYDKENATLTLKNFSWSGSDDGIFATGALNIKLEGENSITSSNSNGIHVQNNLSISGTSADEDSLTVTSSKNGIFAYEPYQSYQESITINSATITVNTQTGAGIAGSKSLTIKDSVINSTGALHGLQGGAFGDNPVELTIENSTITAKATGSDSSNSAIKGTPTLSYDNNYHWRTNDSGDYTNSTTTVYEGAPKYVEIKPGLYNATTPATYSIFDAKIPFANVVDCLRTTKTTVGETQEVHYFDYPISAIKSSSIDNLVPDVKTNPANYYYKFSKGDNDKIVLTLHKVNDSAYSYVLTDDGYIQSYGDGCFVYKASSRDIGTYVTFKLKNANDQTYRLHSSDFCNSCNAMPFSGCASCLASGCGDSFIIKGTNPSMTQLENMPIVNGLVEMEEFYLGVQGTYTFPEATVGYAQPAAKTVTVTNNGDAITEELYVTAYAGDSESDEFVVTELDAEGYLGGIAADTIKTFKIAPVAGLSAGTYTANVVVSNGASSISESFNVSFTVTEGGSAPTPTYGISVSTRNSFNAVEEGYTQSEAGTVSVDVVNTGDTATGDLTVTKTGDVDAFVNSVTTIPSVAAGEDDGIFISAKEGLSAGTYTMTVKIGNDTVGYKEVTLSFTVTEASSTDPTPTPSRPSSSKPTYPAKVEEKADLENGAISFSKDRVRAGRSVTITVTPDAGYVLDKLVILNDTGKAVDFKDNGNGTYTFVMPKGGVEVEPFFVKAAPAKEPVTLVLFVNQVAYMLDGEPMVNDVAPVIKAERTTLPIRLVAETLGAKVDWSEADQTVTITKGDMTIVIYIGQGFALVNGDPVELDCPAYIANSRTYLPVRFVSENLGAEVTWGGADGSVTIVVE